MKRREVTMRRAVQPERLGAKPLQAEDYLSSLQCARRLWFVRGNVQRDPDPGAASEVSGSIEATSGEHASLRSLLQRLFPGGVSAGPDDASGERSAKLLDDEAVPAVFDARCAFGDLEMTADALQRVRNGFRFVTLIGGLRVTDQDLERLAFGAYVLDKRGLRIHSIEVARLSQDYVRQGGPIDPELLFRIDDVTRDVRFLSQDVEPELERMRRRLAQESVPDVEPSPHCRRPSPCPFFEARCGRGLSGDALVYLPGLRVAEFHALREARVVEIGAIPDLPWLRPVQRRARAAHRLEATLLTPDLRARLAGGGPPAAYLDFECASPALPLFEGTRACEPVPLQWSLHSVDERGRITHHAHLAQSSDDPRRAFAEALIVKAAQVPEPIWVYSDFEAKLLRSLAQTLPDLARQLDAIAARLVDLLAIVRSSVYAPGLRGSFSLKRVAAVLVPDLDYANLEVVRDGRSAGRAWLALLRGEAEEATGVTPARLLSALAAYCECDTRALLEVHRVLLARSRATDSARHAEGHNEV